MGMGIGSGRDDVGGGTPIVKLETRKSKGGGGGREAIKAAGAAGPAKLAEDCTPSNLEEEIMESLLRLTADSLVPVVDSMCIEGATDAMIFDIRVVAPAADYGRTGLG